VPSGVEHHEVILVDQAGDEDNPNLAAVLIDAADAVAMLRAEGKRVFLHCVDGRSRTPTVAAVHLVQRDGLAGRDAWQRVADAIPDADPHNRAFQGFLDGLGAR
jgi:ADP-ribosyl-[dinitrogen reductase] hydrolase